MLSDPCPILPHLLQRSNFITKQRDHFFPWIRTSLGQPLVNTLLRIVQTPQVQSLPWKVQTFSQLVVLLVGWPSLDCQFSEATYYWWHSRVCGMGNQNDHRTSWRYISSILFSSDDDVDTDRYRPVPTILDTLTLLLEQGLLDNLSLLEEIVKIWPKQTLAYDLLEVRDQLPPPKATNKPF